MNKSKIFFICPDTNLPTGGVKQIYRQVDVLNSKGFNAYVLHRHYGFKCTWFNNQTQIVYFFPIFDVLDNLLKVKSSEKGILGILLKIKSFYKKQNNLEFKL